jgi:ABC-type multidrug transport system fused ATPase/permease subunit
VLFFVAKGIFGDQVNKVISKEFAEIEADKSSELFVRSTESNLELLDSNSASDLQRALINSVQVGYGYTLTHLSSAFGELILILAVSTYLAVLNFALFAGLLGFLGLVLLWMHFATTQKTLLNASIAEEEWSQSARVVGDFVANFKQVVSSGRASGLIGEFTAHRRRYSLAHGQLFVASAKPRYVIEIALMVGLSGLLVQRVAFPSAAPSPDVLIVFVAGAFRIVASLLPLQGAFGVLKQVEAGARQARALSKLLAVTHAPKSWVNTTSPIAVSFKNVTFSYESCDLPTIENLSFDIARGELVLISGKSGVGKSTLVDLLLGLRRPSNGQVRIYGCDPSEKSSGRDLKLGYVPQNPQFFNATLAENVTLAFSGLQQHDQVRVVDCLTTAGLGDLLSLENGGLHQQVGNNGRSLSGGQLQRLALARALYANPEVLVLDEFTSALDQQTKDDLHKFIIEARGKITMVVISHDLELPFNWDKLIRL